MRSTLRSRAGNLCVRGCGVAGGLAVMSEAQTTSYVETGDGGTFAYQVYGDGPVDLLVCGGAKVPLDLFWEVPDPFACAAG